MKIISIVSGEKKRVLKKKIFIIRQNIRDGIHTLDRLGEVCEYNRFA
jgi:hypothetical protein